MSSFSNAIATFGMGNGANNNYATAHAGNTPVLNNFNDTAGVGIKNQFDGANYNFFRFWLHFDTSSIPDNAVIVSAFLRLPGTATAFTNANSDSIGVYSSTVTTDTTIADTDWTKFGATLLGSVALASYNQAGNNDIALNASGLALINLTGYTKLMVMTTQDHAATVPTGTNNVTFNATGLILSVTYTTESPSASASQSASTSSSASKSASASQSASASSSTSASGSASQSPSRSVSSSVSPSLSPSSSESASASASPSPAEYTNTYQAVGNLFTDKYTSTL